MDCFRRENFHPVNGERGPEWKEIFNDLFKRRLEKYWTCFFAKTKKRHNGSQFRNKFNQLRIRFNEFNDLLKEPGFSWDPALNMIHASDAVWASYAKDNKKRRGGSEKKYAQCLPN